MKFRILLTVSVCLASLIPIEALPERELSLKSALSWIIHEDLQYNLIRTNGSPGIEAGLIQALTPGGFILENHWFVTLNGSGFFVRNHSFYQDSRSFHGQLSAGYQALFIFPRPSPVRLLTGGGFYFRVRQDCYTMGDSYWFKRIYLDPVFFISAGLRIHYSRFTLRLSGDYEMGWSAGMKTSRDELIKNDLNGSYLNDYLYSGYSLQAEAEIRIIRKLFIFSGYRNKNDYHFSVINEKVISDPYFIFHNSFYGGVRYVISR